MHYIIELKHSTSYFRELVFKLFIKVSFISLGININEWTAFPSFACCRRCTVEEIFLSQKKFWFVASLSKTRNVFTSLSKDLKSLRLRIYRTLPPPIFCKTVSIIFCFTIWGPYQNHYIVFQYKRRHTRHCRRKWSIIGFSS